MATTSIKQLQGQEKWDTLHFLTSYAFQSSPPLTDKEKWMEGTEDLKENVVWGMLEDGQAVACAAESVMTQTLRGGTFEMSGLWGVATHPEVRRRGYAKHLLSRALDHARQHGRPVSCLFPFRESFYERLGYATFPQPKKVTFKTAHLASLLDHEWDDAVEMVGIKEGYDRYRAFLSTFQPGVHGMALRRSGHRQRANQNKLWLAFAHIHGRDAGVMAYKLEGEEVTQFTFKARRFYFLTSQAKYMLLAWMARHIDQAEEVELWLPPGARPETWLADLKLTFQQLYIPPMGRVLDLEQIGGVELGPGQFSARIQDPFCPWNEGTWTFSSREGTLEVARGTEAQFTLTIQGLTTLLYGTHEVADFPIRGWGNPTPDLQDQLRTMFPRKTPYLHEFF